MGLIQIKTLAQKKRTRTCTSTFNRKTPQRKELNHSLLPLQVTDMVVVTCGFFSSKNNTEEFLGTGFKDAFQEERQNELR